MLGNKLTVMLTNLGKDERLHYTWFDFHGECKKMRPENLGKLLAILEDDLKTHGYFMATLPCGFD